MKRPIHVQAPKDANGTCRNRRRPQRAAWVRPLLRASRAIQSSARLIGSALMEVSACERRVHRRPVGTARNLREASGRLADASARLTRATRDLAALNECIALDPEIPPEMPRVLVETTESWLYMTEWLGEVADDLFSFHEDVLHGLETGAVVPERPADRRPRIVLAPRPVPIRAFLILRQPRATDRIASILRRRRRTPRPAATDVPPETHQGRAPPRSSVCPL